MRKAKGITLIALVITIVILLILAGVTIASLSGENGILKNATQAKLNTEIATEKEIVQTSVLGALTNSKQLILEQTYLEDELDKQAGVGKTDVTDIGEAFEVLFLDTERFYIVSKNGVISEGQEIASDQNPGDIETAQDGSILDGSENYPYEICSVEDLVKFSQMTNDGETFEGKYVKLINSLNLKSTFSYVDANNTTMFGDYNGDGITEEIRNELNKEESNGFFPIEEFKGVFLGNDKEINGVYINAELNQDNDKIAFFKSFYGTIENLSISGNLKFNVESGQYVQYAIGGITGYSEGIIQNAESEINIEGKIASGTGWLYVGGISGRLSGGTIDNCINTGNMNITGSGDNRVSGIVGHLSQNAFVKNSINEGNIVVESSDYACIGGINFESYDSTIENCANKGRLETINGSRVYLGGITGLPTSTVIKSCYNAGEIVVNGYAPRVGGIAGSPENNTSVENCYNIATISTKSTSSVIRVGGIIGEVTRGEITLKNSYNAGLFDIQGTVNSKGSLYGKFTGSIDNCYYLEQDGFQIGGNTITTITNSGVKTIDEMKSDDFIILLNKSSQAFKKDDSNLNNGYPVLVWQ